MCVYLLSYNFSTSRFCLFIGGVVAKSLAVATDSAHMLTDFASFMISLLAIYLASRRPTTKLSFGWHRAGMYNLFSLLTSLRLAEVFVEGG